MTIIMHVGAPKCGSSSLQAQLSDRPLLSADDGSAHYEYVCITQEGNLLRGDELQYLARLTPYEVQVSSGAEFPWATDHTALTRLGLQFQAILAEGRTPIVSQESWFKQSWIFQENGIFERLGVNAKIVAFVRPQVSWLNSAWWQWGVWAEQEMSEWLEGMVPTVKWTKHLRAWQNVPGVVSVEARPLGGDAVAAFLGSIGIRFAGEKRHNVSLDENLLVYLTTRPDLRTLGNPVVDFVLEQRLAAGSKPLPWHLDRDQISDLIADCRADNLELLSWFSPDDARAMEQEPAWWDAAAYHDRRAVPPRSTELTKEALEDIAGRAIDAVISLDARVRNLEASERAYKSAFKLSEQALARALEAQRALTGAVETQHAIASALEAQLALTRVLEERDALARSLELQHELALKARAAPPAPLRRGRRLRKASSINGIRRLARRMAGSAAGLAGAGLRL